MSEPPATGTLPDGRPAPLDAPPTADGPPAPPAPGYHPFDPPATAGEVGTLGPYRVVRLLGRGGMGEVYLAIDARLNRRLALKVMLPQFAADPAARGRFLREARAAATVTHDHVVTVYEAGELRGAPYIAMQLLRGCPLDEYLRRKGGLTVPQILRVAREAAAGLAAAHAAGLVHRDVKPANLWLEAPHGRVKVLDFGLARPVDADVELTKSGAVIGTPAYMSLEQARGEKVDARADLFSLGAVLYRLCTGRLPFDGPTVMAVLTALGTEDPPPVRELNPAVPPPLADLIHHLLARKPADRPSSAAEVVRRARADADPAAPAPDPDPLADLDVADDWPAAADAPTTPAAVRERPGGRRRWAAAGAAVLIAAAGVAAVIGVGGGESPAPPAPAAGADPDREAAVRVLGLGGTVRVRGGAADVRRADDLPPGRFDLAEVDLAGSKVADDDLAVFRGCKKLTHLRLSRTGVTDRGVGYLNGCQGLTHLWLSRTGVTDAGLRDLPGVAVLDLSGTEVTDAGLADLAENTDLSGLDLSGTGVTDAGLDHLGDCQNLTDLDLSGTRVTGAGLARLTACRGLKHLWLARTRLTGDGLAHLRELPALELLDLSGTGVADAGLAHLRELKGLKLLRLQGSKVTAAGVAGFRAAVPDCNVRYGGNDPDG
jgi:hypothetical protein